MRRSLTRLAARLCAITALSAGVGVPAGRISAAQSELTADAAIELYAGGDFDAAQRFAYQPRFDAASLVRDLDDWAARGLLNSAARRRRAIAFGLEVAWALNREGPVTSRPRPGPSSSLVPLVAWGCDALPGGAHPADRAWLLLSLSLLEHARMWSVLLGSEASSPPSAGPLQKLILREAREGHLSHVKRRLPREPRVRLAGAIAREGTALQALVGPGEGRRPPLLRFDEITPARIAEIEANAAKGSAFRRRVDALAALPSLEASFNELTREPDLAPEARLHLGYLRLIQGDAKGALSHLEGLSGKSADAFVGHLAHYFRGWAFHRLDQRDRAIEAYRDAVALMPGARIASTLLAEQLFLDDRRDEAYALLDRTFTAQTPAYEALVWFKRGGARFIPDQIAALREAIR
jgi:hypothetical protein